MPTFASSGLAQAAPVDVASPHRQKPKGPGQPAHWKHPTATIALRSGSRRHPRQENKGCLFRWHPPTAICNRTSKTADLETGSFQLIPRHALPTGPKRPACPMRTNKSPRRWGGEVRRIPANFSTARSDRFVTSLAITDRPPLCVQSGVISH